MLTIEARIVAIEVLAIELGWSGNTPGTMLSRSTYLGALGWCLSIGGLQQPKKHLYSREIDGVLSAAESWLTGLKETVGTGRKRKKSR